MKIKSIAVYDRLIDLWDDFEHKMSIQDLDIIYEIFFPTVENYNDPVSWADLLDEIYKVMKEHQMEFSTLSLARALDFVAYGDFYAAERRKFYNNLSTVSDYDLNVVSFPYGRGYTTNQTEDKVRSYVSQEIDTQAMYLGARDVGRLVTDFFAVAYWKPQGVLDRYLIATGETVL